MIECTDMLTIFWGLIFIIIPLIFLAMPHTQTIVIESLNKRSVRWSMAIVLFIIGVFHILYYNRWTAGVELFITILGWLVFIKSVLLVSPLPTIKLSRRIMDSDFFSYILMAYILIGLYLLGSVFAFNLL